MAWSDSARAAAKLARMQGMSNKVGGGKLSLASDLHQARVMKKLSKTPMPGARGYFMASKTKTSEYRNKLAAHIKSLRKKK